MPFDGLVVKCIVNELNETIVGGRVEKIYQPEADEIVIAIRSKGENRKLVLSASPNYPRIHLTEAVKENPSAAPVFCMLLRKHLSGGRITEILFHDFERVITILVESVNELGDLTLKKLIIEIMGKHSNIILTNSSNKILDSIKHIDNDVSSKREVMPAREYVFPPVQDKKSPEDLDMDLLVNEAESFDTSVEKQLLNKIKGFSPLLCNEICRISDIEVRTPFSRINSIQTNNLKDTLSKVLTSIRNCNFRPHIIYTDNSLKEPIDFHCIDLNSNYFIKHFDSMSNAMDSFYSSKDVLERMKQKKSDLVKVLNTNIDRCNKKLFFHEEKLREVSDREKLQLYGELITANIYCIPKSLKKVSLLNYYSESNEYLDIILDETITPQQNAQKYFKQYSKAKSTFVNISRQHDETLKDLEYFESVLHLLDNCMTLQEIGEIRQELAAEGYIKLKGRTVKKKNPKSSDPLKFRSSDGFEIFVGKNNIQNDILTLKTASYSDTWLHTKDIPGSHVIIRKLNSEIPESTLYEAALLAAYHSKARMSSNVPVDYTQVKNVKKPSGAKPGMVIYTSYKTIIATPSEEAVNQLRLSNNFK